MTLAFSNNEETRKKIVDTSQKIQEVFEGYKRTTIPEKEILCRGDLLIAVFLEDLK